MSMMARLPPNALLRPPVRRMPRTTNSLGPSMVSSGTRLPSARPLRAANAALIIIESGCARNTSGSSIIAASPLSQVVLAQAAIAGHVDAEHQQIALPGQPRGRHRFDDRRGHAHLRQRLHALEHLFVEAGLAGRDLQFGRAGNRRSVSSKAAEHRLVGGVHRHEHRDADRDARQSVSSDRTRAAASRAS